MVNGDGGIRLRVLGIETSCDETAAGWAQHLRCGPFASERLGRDGAPEVGAP